MASPSPPAPPYTVLVVSLPPTPAPPASASHAIARSALIILGVICLIAAASIAINCLLRRASRRRASASGAAPLPLPRSGPAPAHRAPALLAAADCIVCLCAIVPRAEAQLACRHRFHATCIDEWVRSSPASPTCPLCRAAVQLPRPADAMDQRRTARRSSAAGDRRRVAASGEEAPPGPPRVSGV
nr:putative RING-H2 finger protein ATL69 [Aegilops tauschii subsp. strangulata]